MPAKNAGGTEIYMRKSEIWRKTGETDINLSLDLDGEGSSSVDTGCGFLDHMLTLFSVHGGFDLEVKCAGDVNVDYHHTVEDVGICLGRAVAQAAGDKRGITRYASVTLPMDEALVMCAADVSGRAVLRYNVPFPTEKVGDFDTELVREFWAAFVRESSVTLHFVLLDGENSHHVAEAAFKAAARTLRAALSPDERFGDRIPSSKGTL